MEYTLKKFFELKGCKSLSREQAEAFKVTDYNKGWTKRNASNTVTEDVWKALISNVCHHPETKRGQRGSSRDNQYLYLFKSSNGLYKIGVSKDFNMRARSIRSATGFGLCVEGVWNPGIVKAVTLETLLFKKFGRYRKLGEWFEFPEDHPVIEEADVFLENYNETYNVEIVRVK